MSSIPTPFADTTKICNVNFKTNQSEVFDLQGKGVKDTTTINSRGNAKSKSGERQMFVGVDSQSAQWSLQVVSDATSGPNDKIIGLINVRAGTFAQVMECCFNSAHLRICQGRVKVSS
ncbi:hypothetical protein BDR05DRAFT_878939 [Suillus weaverae]|nr:hypothetical protein BDR05DRAFT_878939 [Suillus weaverae]